MEKKLSYLLREVLKNKFGASVENIQNIEKQANFVLPSQYVEFMMEFNGGEGEVGENSWLFLFPVEELVSVNEDYRFLMEQIPDYFLIGKDAADTGYALQKEKGTFYSFGLMSNFETDEITPCGATFLEFIEYLYNQ